MLELASKYAALARLRARRDGEGGAPARSDLRRLAERHPGCLRELDTLGAEELKRRARAAEACARGAAPEPWMAWILTYHRLMQAALAVKAKLGPKGARARNGHRSDAVADRERLRSLTAVAAAASALPVTSAFVQAVASPPEGRLAIVVLRALGEHFGVSAKTIAGVLFPIRRPSPYTLP